VRIKFVSIIIDWDAIYGALGLERCDECWRPAKWVRYTQFSGNHHFCEKHARVNEDFGDEDVSYFVWKQVI